MWTMLYNKQRINNNKIKPALFSFVRSAVMCTWSKRDFQRLIQDLYKGFIIKLNNIHMPDI